MNFQHDSNFNADVESENGDPRSEDEGPAQCNSHNSNGIPEAKPTTLHFYNGLDGWPNILIHAKKRFDVYISTINGFPEWSKHLDDAAKILAHAIADFEAQGGKWMIVDFPLHSLTNYAITELLLAYQESQDMAIVVREKCLPCSRLLPNFEI